MTLTGRIEAYFKNHYDQWINGGELERLAMDHGYKGSTCGRILRDMSEFADSLLLKEERKNPVTKVTSIFYKLNDKHSRVETYRVPALGKEIKVLIKNG